MNNGDMLLYTHNKSMKMAVTIKYHVCHQEIAEAEEKLKESDVSSSLRAYAEHIIYCIMT